MVTCLHCFLQNPPQCRHQNTPHPHPPILGLVCFVVINPRVLSANRVDYGLLFLYLKIFPILLRHLFPHISQWPPFFSPSSRSQSQGTMPLKSPICVLSRCSISKIWVGGGGGGSWIDSWVWFQFLSRPRLLPRIRVCCFCFVTSALKKLNSGTPMFFIYFLRFLLLLFLLFQDSYSQDRTQSFALQTDENAPCAESASDWTSTRRASHCWGRRTISFVGGGGGDEKATSSVKRGGDDRDIMWTVSE